MRNIDIIALIVSVIVASIMSIITVRKSSIVVRPMAAFLIFFGPLLYWFIWVFISALLINFNAIKNMKKGSFTYDFRYYSLMLMAVVIIHCAGLLLQRIKDFLEGESFVVILKAMAMAMIIVISAPTIPNNPPQSYRLFANNCMHYHAFCFAVC